MLAPGEVGVDRIGRETTLSRNSRPDQENNDKAYFRVDKWLLQNAASKPYPAATHSMRQYSNQQITQKHFEIG